MCYQDGKNKFLSITVMSAVGSSQLYKPASLLTVEKAGTVDTRGALNGGLRLKLTNPGPLSTDGKYRKTSHNFRANIAPLLKTKELSI
jgi:hypothetical protein